MISPSLLATGRAAPIWPCATSSWAMPTSSRKPRHRSEPDPPEAAQWSRSTVARSGTGRRGARTANRGASRGGQALGAASWLRDAPLLDAVEQLDEYPVQLEDHVPVFERRVILKRIVGRTDGEFPIDDSGTGRGQDLTQLGLCPQSPVYARACADDRDRLVPQDGLVDRPGRPVDGVLELPWDRRVVFGRREQNRVGLRDGVTPVRDGERRVQTRRPRRTEGGASTPRIR